MEINQIDLLKLSRIFYTLTKELPCHDGDCDMCQIVDRLLCLERLMELIEKVHARSNTKGGVSKKDILDAIVTGFALAWRYREMVELEELVSKKEEVN